MKINIKFLQLKFILLQLYNKYKSIFILIGWIGLLYIGILSFDRIIKFLIILLVIYLYKYIHTLLPNFNYKLLYNILDKNIYIFLNFLFILSILNNIILFMYTKFELIIYDLIEQISYSKILNINKQYIILLLISIFITSFKLILTKFYIILSLWKNLTVIQILFKRMYGLILSVLIFTNFIDFILYLCNGWLNLFFIIYLILVILSILINLNLINIFYVKNLLEIIKIRKSVSIILRFIIFFIEYNNIKCFQKIKNFIELEFYFYFNKLSYFDSSIAKYALWDRDKLYNNNDILNFFEHKKTWII